ncbi:MAG: hypothetical protein WC269_02505 [Candidatus Gracilibacteria bacterium]|jgi:hypothetical protein
MKKSKKITLAVVAVLLIVLAGVYFAVSNGGIGERLQGKIVTKPICKESLLFSTKEGYGAKYENFEDLYQALEKEFQCPKIETFVEIYKPGQTLFNEFRLECSRSILTFVDNVQNYSITCRRDGTNDGYFMISKNLIDGNHSVEWLKILNYNNVQEGHTKAAYQDNLEEENIKPYADFKVYSRK